MAEVVPEEGQSTERYYAEMEAARNWAEEEYFSARPQLLATGIERSLFRAGFERAYSSLWNQTQKIAKLEKIIAGLVESGAPLQGMEVARG